MNQANMICPNCGDFQEMADTCLSCGLVVAKIRSEQPASRTVVNESLSDRGETSIAVVRHDSMTLSQPAKFMLAAVAVVILTSLYFLFAPKTMSIDEFVEAKKSSFHARGFRIEGTAERYESYIITQRSDGKALSSLKISGPGKTGIVTYDPDQLAQVPATGDYVRVTGSFDRVPYYGGPGTFKTMTMALATSITVIRKETE